MFAGQLMVALSFAELAGRYPVAGSVYNWSKQLAGGATAWLAGWMMLTASVVTISAVVLAYQLVLPQIWSGFQLVAMRPTAVTPRSTGCCSASCSSSSPR